MKTILEIANAVVLSLIAAVDLCAQPGSAERRPSLDELKPVLDQSTQQAVQTLFASSRPSLTLTEMEVVEIGSPGWKYSTNSTNEVVCWPVRIKCAVNFTDEGGKSVSQRVGILYLVSRDEGGKCKAEFCDLFDGSTLEERAAKLKASVDSARKAKEDAGRIACLNNLRQLDGAKMEWALENRKSNSDTPTVADLKPYLSRKQMVVCPAGGTYTIGSMSANPTCSIKGHKL
jgi:hypothetical protein